jgi:hypothetical protein
MSLVDGCAFIVHLSAHLDEVQYLVEYSDKKLLLNNLHNYIFRNIFSLNVRCTRLKTVSFLLVGHTP